MSILVSVYPNKVPFKFCPLMATCTIIVIVFITIIIIITFMVVVALMVILLSHYCRFLLHIYSCYFTISVLAVASFVDYHDY